MEMGVRSPNWQIKGFTALPLPYCFDAGRRGKAI